MEACTRFVSSLPMWMPRSNPSPCARTTRMSPTRGLWGSGDARASYFGLCVGKGPGLDRPDELRLAVDVGLDVARVFGGEPTFQGGVLGGRLRIASELVAERQVAALP